MTEITANKIIVAGGTGFLGQAVAKRLESAGHEAVVLSRRRPGKPIAGRWVGWDGQSVDEAWRLELDGAAAVINLTGRTVDCRKTPDRCDEILRSREDSVTALGEAMARCDAPPSVWVQAGTAHLYGDPPDRVCDESTSPGYGLAPYVAQRWEDAFKRSCPAQTRGVILRTSFVLGAAGGALPVLARLARLGLGGRIGTGRQWISWLHVDDFCGIVERALTDPSMDGAYNTTAPSAATNAQFMQALRRAVHRPIGLPSPAWLVRLGAATFLDTDPELPLFGRRVIPKRLNDAGFVFQFPALGPALDHLLRAEHLH